MQHKRGFFFINSQIEKFNNLTILIKIRILKYFYKKSTTHEIFFTEPQKVIKKAVKKG